MSDPLDAVIAEPYHLTCAVADHSDTDKHLRECMEPQTDWPCKQCWEIDCECTCICDRLRACELRVRTEPFDVAYLAGLNAAIEAIRGLSQTRTENGTVVTPELGHWDRGMNLQESHSAADKNHTHDPLCPVNQYRGFPDPTGLATAAACRCDLIAMVREDERRERVMLKEALDYYKAPVTQAVRQGWYEGVSDCIAALRALQEKP